MSHPRRLEEERAERRFAPDTVPGDRLRAATTHVLETTDSGASGRAMGGTDTIAAALSEIVRSVEKVWAGEELPPFDADIPKVLLYRRLCDAIASRLLCERTVAFEDDDGHSPSESTLNVLSALQRYREQLSGSGEDVLTNLTEPEAMELVVEIAHDLRSPLSSILFLAETLRSGHTGPVNENQRSQLGLVYSATLGMITAVNDVMDLATGRKGLVDDDPVDFSLGEVFASVEEMVAPMAEEGGVDLRFELPGYDRCVGYPILLGRVILNLTTNGIKFAEEGQVVVAAERVDSTTVELSVRDTGRGMAEEALADLFNPLRKAAAREGHFFSRSGLGLVIVRRLLTAMGSNLQVETSLGDGTRFYFRLELPPVGDI